MVNFYYRESLSKDLEKLDQFKVGSWIQCEKLSDEEILELAEKFGLEEGHLNDALDPFEVPRLEMEGDIAYVFIRVPEDTKEGVITVPLLVIIAPTFILTLSSKHISLLDKFIDGTYKFYTAQKVEFFSHIYFSVIASYNKHLSSISRQVRRIKIRLERIENKDIIQFVDFEQVLNDFISVLIPHSSIFRGLLRSNVIPMQEENKDLLEDMLLSNDQLVEVSKANLKSIVNIRDAYSTIMSQDLNRVIKILTSLTILITVPTMISSFYGMNVKLPFEQSQVAYTGILGLTIASMIVLYVIFRKNRWL